MFSFQIFVGSRRELVANSIHTADADATQLVGIIRPVLGYCTPVWHYAITRAQYEQIHTKACYTHSFSFHT